MSAGFRAGTSNDGYLQINGTDILTVSSGVLGVKNTGAQSEMRLYCESNNAHYASLKSPPHSDFIGNVTFTLPGTSGSSGQVLQTDGSGNLSWVNQSGGGGGGGVSDKMSEGNTEAEVVDTGTDGHFKVTTEGVERLRVDSDGKLILTTGTNSGSSPGGGDNLVIKDSDGCGISILSGDGNSQNIYLGSVTDSDGVRLEGFYNSGSPYFNIYTGGTERLRINSSGELISTNGTLRREVETSSFAVSGGTASNSGANINLYGASHSSLANIFRVRTGATERLRVGPSGQIGLGGANYGTSGQVLTSGGASGAVSWTTISGAGGSYGNSDVDNHLNSGAASSGQILSWNGSDYAWVADQGGSGGGGISDLVDDTTPQLGGNLSLNSNNITGTGDINITGDLDITGDVEIDTLTASGICTFNNFLRLPGGTFANNQIQLGNSQEFTFQYNTSSTRGIIQVTGQEIAIRATTIRLQPNGGENGINVNLNGSVELYHDNAKKLETTSTGATVTGTLTATTFSGSGASLTTLNASELDSGTIPDARFPATLPAASGANLTNLPAANITGTLPAISGANLTNLPSDTPADTDVQVTYDLGANGSSAYRFTGPGYSGADDNPDLYLVRGQRYRFINATGGHPFRIQSNTSGTAYTDGVSGSQTGTQDFNVQYNAPERLYYQCTSHAAMIGNIYIVGASDWRMTDVATSATPEIYTDRKVYFGMDTSYDNNSYGQFKEGISIIRGDENGVVANATAAGQPIGSIFFNDARSATYASIRCAADGTPGTNDYPGRLIFRTTSDGSSSTTERMRIDSSGRLKLGSNTLVTPNTNADNFVIDTGDVDSGISILSATTGRIYFGDADLTDAGSIRYVHTDNSMRFETNSAERLRIDSVGIIKTPNLNANNHREIHRQITGFAGGSGVVNYLLVCETSRINVRLAGRLFTARATGTSACASQLFDITFQTNHNASHRSGAIMGLHSGSNTYGHAEAEFVSLTYNSTNYYAIRFNGSNNGGWTSDFDTCSFDGIREHVGTELFTQINTATHSISNVSVLTDAANKGDVTIQQADLRISDGDIIMASGHGISFSANANAAGMTSEVLDDYEEGTFTATCSNSVVLNGSSNLCQYVKIGSMVTVMGQIQVSNSNGASSLTINNLPFTVVSSGEGSGLSVGAVRLYNADMASDHKYVICMADPGVTNLAFQGVRDNATSQGLAASTGGYYMFNIVYRTST